MLTANRRALLAGLGATLGMPLALQRALAAGSAPGFEPSRALFTAEQRDLAAAVSERIVPTTDTPGAITAGVPAFMELMLCDWHSAAERDDFLAGMAALDDAARARHGKVFAAAMPEQQDAILTAAMDKHIGRSDFFDHCRQMVLLGYFSSEIGCTVERVYVPVPGRYDGAYPYAGRVFSS